MAAGKFITLVILISVLNNSNAPGNNNLHFKYSETANNFLDTNAKIADIADIIESAGKIIDGDIVKAERKFKKNILIWKINVLMSSGGFVNMELSAADKKILQIEAEEGPFEYELTPADGIITFNSAKKKSEEHSGQKILKWNLKQNKDKFEYSFWMFTKSGKAQVKIDAESGDLILNSKNSRKKK